MYHVHGLKYSIKMSILSKLIHRFDTISQYISTDYFAKTGKSILKFMNMQRA